MIINNMIQIRIIQDILMKNMMMNLIQTNMMKIINLRIQIRDQYQHKGLQICQDPKVVIIYYTKKEKIH